MGVSVGVDVGVAAGVTGVLVGMGSGVLVFGSPRNRRRGSLAADRAAEIAIPFFRALGDLARDHGVAVGLEANPVEYGCDFLTRHAEVQAFVERLGHPAIVHHVDLGGVALAGEDPVGVIEAAVPLRHLHASTPHLAPPDPNSPLLGAAVDTLARTGYDGWISIEMRRQAVDPVGAVLDAVRAIQAAFRAA